MYGFILLILIIVIFANIANKAKEEQTTVNKFLNDAINKRIESKKPNSVNNEASYQINRQPNSYYNKEKIDKYRKQDMDHSEHLIENESVDTKKIGYNRCPKCGTLNSKKLDRCFMCNEEIKKEA